MKYFTEEECEKLKLCLDNKLTLKEIAQIMGRSEFSIKGHIHRNGSKHAYDPDKVFKNEMINKTKEGKNVKTSIERN